MIVMLGFYRKLPHLSTEEFRAHWNDHGEVVRSIPGYEKYIKKYVQHQLSLDPKSGTDLLYDGFSEGWFESVAMRDEFFARSDFSEILRHEALFLDMDTSKRWLVFDEPRVQI